MKKTIISLVAILSLCHAFAQRETEGLNKLLCNLGKQDQEVRLNLNRAVQRGIADSIVYYAEMQTMTDLTNQQQLQQICKSGIPENLSPEAYNAIFLIVDHADIQFQKRHFRTLSNLAKQGHIKPSSMATLQDRMLMRRNRKQIYGTQTVAKPIVITGNETKTQMTNYVWPVKAPTKLNMRRSGVGLCAIEEQTHSHALYGYEMIYDPALSKHDIRKLTRKE